MFAVDVIVVRSSSRRARGPHASCATVAPLARPATAAIRLYRVTVAPSAYGSVFDSLPAKSAHQCLSRVTVTRSRPNSGKEARHASSGQNVFGERREGTV